MNKLFDHGGKTFILKFKIRGRILFNGGSVVRPRLLAQT